MTLKSYSGGFLETKPAKRSGNKVRAFHIREKCDTAGNINNIHLIPLI